MPKKKLRAKPCWWYDSIMATGQAQYNQLVKCRLTAHAVKRTLDAKNKEIVKRVNANCAVYIFLRIFGKWLTEECLIGCAQ